MDQLVEDDESKFFTIRLMFKHRFDSFSFGIGESKIHLEFSKKGKKTIPCCLKNWLNRLTISLWQFNQPYTTVLSEAKMLSSTLDVAGSEKHQH